MRSVPQQILSVLFSAIAFGSVVAGSSAAAQGVLYQEAGAYADEFVGGAVAVAGDVNGDGYADLLVGAPHAKETSGDDRVGRVRIIAGQSGALLSEHYGTSAYEHFGQAVSGAGDMDADGFADIVIGAPGADLLGEDSGLVRILSGKTGAELFAVSGDSAFDGFGSAVAAAGDVDGDGHADVIVGAPTDDPQGLSSGSARVLSGLTGATLLLLKGESAYDQCGWSVAGAGDVNGDGHADLIVGSPWDVFAGLAAGSARVFSGTSGAVLLTLRGDAANDEFGCAVAGVGDVSGDGVPDLLVGARFDDAIGSNAGSAFLYSGVDGALLRELHGVAANDLFGSAVSPTGDMNGDGVPDMLVGAPHDHCDGTNCGAAYAFSGKDGTELFVFHGDAKDQLGYSVGGGGDADGDGLDDMIVGAPYSNNTVAAGGLARAISASMWLNASLALGSESYSSLLIATGTLHGNTPITLSLSHAAPLAPSVLVLGFSLANIPFKGGLLVPYPDLVASPMPTNAAGVLTVAGLWPNGVPADLEVAVQYWTLDPASPAGFSSSNALVATTP